jgi:type II secretory pathway component PulF
VFPPTVVQIIDVGQRTGKLENMMERLAEDYDSQVQVATQRMVALLEPAVILLLAGFVGFIVLAVILPYMEAGNVF